MYELSAIMMDHNSKIIDSSASNLANIQTPGYHAERYDIVFSDLMDTPVIGGAEYSDVTQGKLKRTSNQNSFAIENVSFNYEQMILKL